MWSSGGVAVIVTLQLCFAAAFIMGDRRGGGPIAMSDAMAEESVVTASDDNGPKLVCYYTPTGYFPASKVPSKLCTHLIYAFGSISGSSGMTPPTAGVKAIWTTLTDLRQENPQLKVMLSLQHGFPNVVGSDVQKMKTFAINSVDFLRNYGFDGVDMDWEYPSSSQSAAFAQFFTIMRAAIVKDAQTRGKPPLLLSLALPNNKDVASRYSLRTIAAAVDFGTAMTYDFHVYSSGDSKTGFNSPLFTPPREYQYLSASAMAQYYMTQGFPAPKLLLGIPTYGRSWTLASASVHGLHAQAVGKGAPGPYRHLTGIYTYPDACVALKQRATRVYDSEAGAVYLYKDTTWVAYDDVSTVTAKVKWARSEGMGGVGVWAMHIDDVAGVCGQGTLPLIKAMNQTLAMSREQPFPLLPLPPATANHPLTAGEPKEDLPASGPDLRFDSSQQNENREAHVPANQKNPNQFPSADVGVDRKEAEESSLVLGEEWSDLQLGASDGKMWADERYGWMLRQSQRVGQSRGGAGDILQHPRSHDDAVFLMENVDVQLEEESAAAASQHPK